MRGFRFPLACLILALFSACRHSASCLTCGTVVIAAVNEPASVLPPLAVETVARDIGDMIYERLADLTPGRATIDEKAYVPRLAARWERVDSLTWRFGLRAGARWQDGQPVTASDVKFSFEVFADSIIDAVARSELQQNITGVDIADSGSVLIHFAHFYPEQLYDATYHVRIIPRHIWEAAGPRARWGEDTTLAHLVGSGPYRVQQWDRGQSLTLLADSLAKPVPSVRRLVWRFTGNADAAANLLLSHSADLLEVTGLASAERLVADTNFRLIPYPSANYGLLGFRIRGDHPRPADAILSDRSMRRALSEAVDRTTIARGVFGPETKVPPGPISQLLWIWDKGVDTIPYDTLAALHGLDAAGWMRTRNGMRSRGGRPLKLDILVPVTSSPRRRAAEAIQAAWKTIGVDASVTLVDFPVFQEKLGRGDFDTFVGAWQDEPTPRALADQWGRRGWTDINYGHYDNPAVDSLLAAAGSATDPVQARLLYHQVLDSLNADVPAIFLFAPTNIATVSKRLELVNINPYSWLSRLPEWKLRERDR